MVKDNLLAMFIGPQKADQLYFYHFANETWEKVNDFGHGTAGGRCSSFLWEDREGSDDIVIVLITSAITENSHFFSLRVISNIFVQYLTIISNFCCRQENGFWL